jgi:hypothetical protein
MAKDYTWKYHTISKVFPSPIEDQKALLKDMLKTKVKKAKPKKTAKPKEDEKLTPKEAIDKLLRSCDGCTGDDACCAIASLKEAGWEVKINPAVAYDRQGYQITILEPKKEETNVQSTEATKPA